TKTLRHHVFGSRPASAANFSTCSYSSLVTRNATFRVLTVFFSAIRFLPSAPEKSVEFFVINSAHVCNQVLTIVTDELLSMANASVNKTKRLLTNVSDAARLERGDVSKFFRCAAPSCYSLYCFGVTQVNLRHPVRRLKKLGIFTT